jgi:hypothetical protein
VINKDELEPLLEKEAASKWLNLVAGTFLAVATFLSISCFKDIISILNDDSIPLVVCPKSFDLDSPVLMKTIQDAPPGAKDKWIKGFIRRIIVKQYPRAASEAEESLKYVVDHSENAIHRKYQGYLDKIFDFKNLLSQGFSYSFYPSNSLDIQIRASGSHGEWAVEVPGFLIRSVGAKEERSTVTLRYLVQAGEHTMTNPEGLYIVDGNLLELADVVSGREKGSK